MISCWFKVYSQALFSTCLVSHSCLLFCMLEWIIDYNFHNLYNKKKSITYVRQQQNRTKKLDATRSSLTYSSAFKQVANLIQFRTFCKSNFHLLATFISQAALWINSSDSICPGGQTTLDMVGQHKKEQGFFGRGWGKWGAGNTWLVIRNFKGHGLQEGRGKNMKKYCFSQFLRFQAGNLCWKNSIADQGEFFKGSKEAVKLARDRRRASK